MQRQNYFVFLFCGYLAVCAVWDNATDSWHVTLLWAEFRFPKFSPVVRTASGCFTLGSAQISSYFVSYPRSFFQWNVQTAAARVAFSSKSKYCQTQTQAYLSFDAVYLQSSFKAAINCAINAIWTENRS